jgi:hypothetical protein
MTILGCLRVRIHGGGGRRIGPRGSGLGSAARVQTLGRLLARMHARRRQGQRPSREAGKALRGWGPRAQTLGRLLARMHARRRQGQRPSREARKARGGGAPRASNEDSEPLHTWVFCR